MKIKKVCENCGKEFEVFPCRSTKAKYCSRRCSDAAKKNNNLNCVCPICGKAFYRKPCHLKKYGRSLGVHCSRACLDIAKRTLYAGERNHQYGLKGPLNSSFKGFVISEKNNRLTEQMVYCPNHPFSSKNGRVAEHRLVVEDNYSLFDSKYFTVIDGKHYLLPSSQVHHKDYNHNNNSISNLIPCTRKEHKRYHKSIITKRDSLGRIIDAAVIKQGELLENPEVDNQQPSQPLTKLEGSETNS